MYFTLATKSKLDTSRIARVKDYFTSMCLSVSLMSATYDSNTLSHPWAMMIKLQHTVVADWAMRRTWWTVYHTCFTEFYFNNLAVNNLISGSRQFSTIDGISHQIQRYIGWCLWIRRLWAPWYYSRITCRCYEQEYKILHDSHIVKFDHS